MRPVHTRGGKRSTQASTPGAPQYNAAGDPVVLAPPQPAPGQYAPQIQPQARADDGYIYPSDGSSNEPRYPAPRRRYDAQAYQQQQYYYGNNGYQQPQYAPPGYQSRPYYQQREFFGTYQD